MFQTARWKEMFWLTSDEHSITLLGKFNIAGMLWSTRNILSCYYRTLLLLGVLRIVVIKNLAADSNTSKQYLTLVCGSIDGLVLTIHIMCCSTFLLIISRFSRT